jgi:hypothetical protein
MRGKGTGHLSYPVSILDSHTGVYPAMPDTTEAQHELEPIYYHGSPIALSVGSYVEPPRSTATRHFDMPEANFHRVFVTSVYAKAVHYAYLRASQLDLPLGKVYRVKPTGKLTPDPTDFDAYPANAFYCSSALVLEILSPTQAEFATARERILPRIAAYTIGGVLSMAAAFVTGARGKEPGARGNASGPVDIAASHIERASAIIKKCRDMATQLQAEADARNGQLHAGSA